MRKRLSAVVSRLSGAAENSEFGANPKRYRHCMRVGTSQGESRSLRVSLEKAVTLPVRRKSGDLLKRDHTFAPEIGADGCCESAEKRPRRSQGVAAAVLLSVPGTVPPPDASRYCAVDCPRTAYLTTTGRRFCPTGARRIPSGRRRLPMNTVRQNRKMVSASA